MPAPEAIEAHRPLKPVWLEILVTLAGGAAHGYAIRQEVEERTEGRVRLWPTTLYGALERLEAAGLIEETQIADAPDDEIPRRFYELTRLGHAVLAAEVERLAELAGLARSRQRRTRPGMA